MKPQLPRLLSASARSIAAFWGGFSLLNVLGEAFSPRFDANSWWLDLSVLPAPVADIFMVVGGGLLLAFAFRPEMNRARRWATACVAALVVLVSLLSSLQYFQELSRGLIHSPRPVPVSGLVALAMLPVVASCLRKPTQLPRAWSVAWPALALIGFAVFPLSQMVLYGKTDYRRQADAVVVFGARVYPSGKPSLALADRVRTASRLVTSGKAKWLIVSGGPGDRNTHETNAMADLAVRLGVPEDRILIDRQGLTTEATVKNSLPLLNRIEARRVLVVSHFYHLPRVKLEYQRAGRDVYTVPATETRRLRRLPYFMAREVAALWVYYLRPLGRG